MDVHNLSEVGKEIRQVFLGGFFVDVGDDDDPSFYSWNMTQVRPAQSKDLGTKNEYLHRAATVDELDSPAVGTDS